MTSCAERCVDPFVPAPRSACAVECADIVRRLGRLIITRARVHRAAAGFLNLRAVSKNGFSSPDDRRRVRGYAPFALALALSLHLLYAIFFALANFLFMKYV